MVKTFSLEYGKKPSLLVEHAQYNLTIKAWQINTSQFKIL